MPEARQGLRRAVSRWEIVSYSLNDVIGSGVYLLPAAAAALLGPASLWAVGLAGLAVALIVLCFAEASTHFRETGSGYLYARAAFGDFVGFEVGWMTWLARVASVSSLSAGFAQAVSYWWPGAAQGPGRTVAVLLPLLALTAINVAGVKASIRTSVLMVATKVIPLLIFVGGGIWLVSVETVRSQTATEPGGLVGAALLLLYAYAGFENTPAPAGEFKRPRRDIPFALLTQITLVTVLYVLVQWVVLGTLPEAGSSSTPLADAARRFLGSWGGWMLTVGGAVSILGTNHNTILAGPRYLYALACDGFGPRFLAAVHPRFQTPANAIVLQSAIAIPLALTGTFVGLAALSVVARLVTYLGTTAAVPVLRRKLGSPGGRFRLPGGPVIPIAASLLALAFAASAQPVNLIAAAIALAIGAVLYRFRRRD